MYIYSMGFFLRKFTRTPNLDKPKNDSVNLYICLVSLLLFYTFKKNMGGGSSFIINSLNSKLIKENCFEKKRWESGLATGLPDVIRPCFIF